MGKQPLNNTALNAGEGSFLVNLQKYPLNIIFSNIGTLNPQDDITPLEAVRLCMAMVCAHAGSNVDYPAFIKENALERHFTK